MTTAGAHDPQIARTEYGESQAEVLLGGHQDLAVGKRRGWDCTMAHAMGWDEM